MERPVTFRNRNNRTLAGIVHVPDREVPPRFRTGITLVNPGIKYRVAPHRLSVKVARALCRLGYHVLRFDPEGIGDSEGELEQGVPVLHLWRTIQTGRFVADTLAANSYLIDEFRVENLVVMGNCGGAITSLLAGSVDDRVDGIVMIDVPVLLIETGMSYADWVPEGGERANRMFRGYVNKALSPQAWWRFLTLQTDYRAFWKALNMKMRSLRGKTRADAGRPVDIAGFCKEKSLNPRFYEAFDRSMQKGRKVLFCLAEKDFGTEFFRSYFEEAYLNGVRSGTGWKESVEILRIRDANHIYTFIESQNALMEGIARWLTSRYPAS